MDFFDKVTAQAGRVLIVASGPSAVELDLQLVARARNAGVYVVAVNRAWDWCRTIDAWFTLDPDHKVQRLLTQPAGAVQRYVAVPTDYGTPNARVHFHRNCVRLPGVMYLERRQGTLPLKGCPGLSCDPQAVHTGNSAYGALGLAFHMKPQAIAFVGVDANGEGYAFQGGWPGPLAHLPELFASALPQLEAAGIEVRNGSEHSGVDCFPRCKPNTAVEWLAGI